MTIPRIIDSEDPAPIASFARPMPMRVRSLTPESVELDGSTFEWDGDPVVIWVQS